MKSVCRGVYGVFLFCFFIKKKVFRIKSEKKGAKKSKSNLSANLIKNVIQEWGFWERWG
jgi:hypothetical protein